MSRQVSPFVEALEPTKLNTMSSAKSPPHIGPSRRAPARLWEKECSHTQSPSKVCVDGAALIVGTGDSTRHQGEFSRTYTKLFDKVVL